MLNDLLESNDWLKKESLKHNIFWEGGNHFILMAQVINLSETFVAIRDY